MTGIVIYSGGGPEANNRKFPRNTVPPLQSVITITEGVGLVLGGHYRVLDVRYPNDPDRSYFEVYATWEPVAGSYTDTDGNEHGFASR